MSSFPETDVAFPLFIYLVFAWTLQLQVETNDNGLNYHYQLNGSLLLNVLKNIFLIKAFEYLFPFLNLHFNQAYDGAP